MFTMRPVIIDAEAVLAIMCPHPTQKHPDQEHPYIIADRHQVYTTQYNVQKFQTTTRSEWWQSAICDPSNKPMRIMRCVVMVDAGSCPRKRFSIWSRNFDKPKNILIDVDTNNAYLSSGNWLIPEDWDINMITNMTQAKSAIEHDFTKLFEEL